MVHPQPLKNFIFYQMAALQIDSKVLIQSLFNQITPFEHLNVYKNRCEIPHWAAGVEHLNLHKNRSEILPYFNLPQMILYGLLVSTFIVGDCPTSLLAGHKPNEPDVKNSVKGTVSGGRSAAFYSGCEGTGASSRNFWTFCDATAWALLLNNDPNRLFRSASYGNSGFA